MKSIKKRFKCLLADIEILASELLLLSAGLTLLSDMQVMADKIVHACKDLKLLASELSKDEFVEGIADTEAVSALEEVVDADDISVLEQRFFAALDNHADSLMGELLQQLLEKLEKRYRVMIENIQQLTALLDE